VLANALIHADYYGRRGIVIEKRRNKIDNNGIEFEEQNQQTSA
jgi:hypothetical protein